jgi:hypothetical protein
MSVHIRTTRRYIPEDGSFHFHNYSCENLKFYKLPYKMNNKQINKSDCLNECFPAGRYSLRSLSCGMLYDALISRTCSVKSYDDWWIENDMEESDGDLIDVISRNLPGRTRQNQGVPAEIRAE